MAIQHASIPDADKHEPKGAFEASKGEVYIADGAGSGSWGKLFNLVDSIEVSGTGGGGSSQYELTGLDDYETAVLVISYAKGGTNGWIKLRIDDNGTFRTTGYRGGGIAKDSTADNFADGFPLSYDYDNSRDFLAGVFWLNNLNGGAGGPFCSGTAFNSAQNFIVSRGGGASVNVMSCGRNVNASNVTKVRLVFPAATSSGASMYIHLYGIR